MNRTHRFSACYCIFCGLIAAMLTWLVLFSTSAASAQEPQKKKKPISFINDVAPILRDNCLACHDAKKKSGKYNMSTYEGVLAKGIEPGSVDDSDMHYLMVTDEERRMPPRDKGEAVPAKDAAIIGQWINEGAKLDAGLKPDVDLVQELRKRWTPPTPPVKYAFPAVVNAIVFAPDGSQLVVSGHFELFVYDSVTGKLLKRVYTRSERAYAMLFLPTGELVVAGGRPGQEGDVCIYDLNAKPSSMQGAVAVLDGVRDAKVLKRRLLESEDSLLCLAMDESKTLLAAGGTDKSITVWKLNREVAKIAVDQVIDNHADWVLGLSFTEKNQYLLSASRDKTVKTWDLAKKESVTTFPGHQEIVYDVMYDSKTNLGYSVGKDFQVRTWKPGGDAKQVKGTAAHKDEVFKIAMAPDGKSFVTASADKTVRIWDITRLNSTQELEGMDDHIFSLAIQPDKQWVAAGSYSGKIMIWNLETKKVVQEWIAGPGFTAASKE